MKTDSEKRIAFGGEFKALGDGRVGGYLVKYTDPERRDLYREYFDKNTDFMLDDYPVMGANVLYNHGLDTTVGVKAIGKIDKVEDRDFGLWVEAQLQMRDEYERMIAEWTGKGLTGWSSGALPQGVVVEDDGHIKLWPIIEGSITLTPAMPHDTAIQTLSAFRSGLAAAQVPDDATERDAKEHSQVPGVSEGAASDELPLSKSREEDEVIMTREEVMALIEEYLSAMSDKMDLMPEEEEVAKSEMRSQLGLAEDEAELDPAEMRSVFEAKIDNAVGTAVAAVANLREQKRAKAASAVDKALNGTEKPVSRAKSNGGGYHNSGNISVGEERRFSGLTAEQMALGYLIMKGNRTPISDAYIRSMTHKAVAHVQGNPFKRHEDNAAVKSAIPFRADEIDATNISGQGQDWVGVYYPSMLWEKARDQRELLGQFEQRGMFMQEIPQGMGSVKIPTEGADPVAYSSPEANDLDATNRVEVTANVGFIGTGSVTMTPGQVKIAAAFTDEQNEDSVIGMLPQTTNQMNIKALEEIENLLINGDTETDASTNINLIDGTPGTGINRPSYLAVNGLRKYPLVTNTDYAASAAGGLSIETYRLIQALMSNKVRQRKGNLLYIIDGDTENASLAISEIATEDVRRTAATIQSGRLLNIYGVDVYVSGFLNLANTAGKISATPGNNTTGSVLLAYAPYWAFGWKREISVKTQEDILSGATYVVASMRFGLVARGADSAAIYYNVGIS